MGHYVLHHVPRGMAFAAVLIFLCFWLGAHVVDWLLAHFGHTLAHHLLAGPRRARRHAARTLAIAQILTEPIANAFSRHIEHAADVYGQEAIHGIVPDPAATAASSFQRLGEQNLETARTPPTR